VAQHALPPGAVRRRTAFGLLDADGWSWAGLKALFWFLLIIFLLAYVPDRAYYFTVAPTIDVGFNAISPINLCPAENKNLPCPAPAGAVVPWELSPMEIALPEGRAGAGAFNSGENLYLIGGRTASGATASVLTTVVTDGNLTGWTEGPPLPEPRSDAALVALAGVPYLIGGRDASGAPVATLIRGTIEEGLLTAWETIDAVALPTPIADLVAVPTVTGILAIGGRGADDVPTSTVYRTQLNTAGTQLGAWQEVTELPLPEARADGSAIVAGNSIYVLGGEGPEGPSHRVFYLELGSEGQPAIDHSTGRAFGWGVSVGQSEGYSLPEPRARHGSFTNSGAIYLVGGVGPDGGLTPTNYWAVPEVEDGSIPEWRVSAETNLIEPRAEAATAAIGSHVFVIGGDTPAGPSATMERAQLAPALPFFRLGLFGVTVPALSIKGEIGQQLGYAVAAGVGTGNLVLLILIGIAYSHRRATMRIIERVSRGRYRAPPDEDDYRA
jgi:hypothetical protein